MSADSPVLGCRLVGSFANFIFCLFHHVTLSRQVQHQVLILTQVSLYSLATFSQFECSGAFHGKKTRSGLHCVSPCWYQALEDEYERMTLLRRSSVVPRSDFAEDLRKRSLNSSGGTCGCVARRLFLGDEGCPSKFQGNPNPLDPNRHSRLPIVQIVVQGRFPWLPATGKNRAGKRSLSRKYWVLRDSRVGVLQRSRSSWDSLNGNQRKGFRSCETDPERPEWAWRFCS